MSNAFEYNNVLSPIEEAAAYECIWSYDKASFKTISNLSKRYPNEKLSTIINENNNLQEYIDFLLREFNRFREEYKQEFQL